MMNCLPEGAVIVVNNLTEITKISHIPEKDTKEKTEENQKDRPFIKPFKT
jgi:hypothetical protein